MDAAADKQASCCGLQLFFWAAILCPDSRFLGNQPSTFIAVSLRQSSISPGFPIVHLFLGAECPTVGNLVRAGPRPMGGGGASLQASADPSLISGLRGEAAVVTHRLRTLMFFSFGKFPSGLVIFLLLSSFLSSLLLSLFSLLTFFQAASPAALPSPGLGGSGCLVCGSVGTRTMELPFLLPFPYQISYYSLFFFFELSNLLR